MKKNYFQYEWLHDEEYKGWLQRGSDNKHFRCMLCKKDLALTNMGAMALKKHREGEKHKAHLTAQSEISNFFQPSSASTSSSAASSSSAAASSATS